MLPTIITGLMSVGRIRPTVLLVRNSVESATASADCRPMRPVGLREGRRQVEQGQQ
jgi:hypothetical protein